MVVYYLHLVQPPLSISPPSLPTLRLLGCQSWNQHLSLAVGLQSRYQQLSLAGSYGVARFRPSKPIKTNRGWLPCVDLE
jgi:hypothetical protein